MDEQLFPKPEPRPMMPAGPELTSLATRLKLLEERYSNLQKRNQLTENELLSFEKEAKTELRIMTTQLVELRRHITEINGKVDTMLGELGNVVKKHEFAVVERYLDLWQPMKFVTKEEAKRLIEVKRG